MWNGVRSKHRDDHTGHSMRRTSQVCGLMSGGMNSVVAADRKPSTNAWQRSCLCRPVRGFAWCVFPESLFSPRTLFSFLLVSALPKCTENSKNGADGACRECSSSDVLHGFVVCGVSCTMKVVPETCCPGSSAKIESCKTLRITLSTVP